MRKIFMMAILFACAAPAAFAQTTNDYNKVEGYVGYSHNRVDTGISDEDEDFDDIFDEREGFNGFNASVTGNFSRYVGAKFDYSFHRKEFGFEANNTDVRLHNFLGGVQFKDNSRDASKVVKPFAHLLVGGARIAADLSDFDDEFEDVSDTGFAAAVGGGLDIRVHDRVDIRAFQFDWNPTRFSSDVESGGIVTSQTRTQHNFRIGVGIVFH